MKVKNYDNLHLFIQKFVRSKYKFTLSFDAKDTINEVIKLVSEKYITKCIELAKYSDKITIDSLAITTLTKIWFPNEANDILNHCTKKWDCYNSFEKAEKKKIFYLQPSRFRNFFIVHKYTNQHISETATVYLCCILEYILNSIFMEINTNVEIVKSIHIYDIIYDTPFLKIFFKEYMFLSG